MIALGALLQIAVAVQAPDTIVARDAVPVLVRATVPGNTPPSIAPLRAPGASLDVIANEVRVGGGFGQAVATREVRYVLRAPSAGRVVIAPPVASLGRDTASAPSHPLVVLDAATAVVPAVVERAPVDPRRLVDFHALVTPDTVWVGEQVTVQAGVFIDEAGRTKLRRNPEYVPSTVDGAVAYDLPLRLRELPVRVVGGTRFRAFVFARALFPLRPGTLVVPASRLSYGLGVGSALFGREETVTLESERHIVVVRTPPTAGRPRDWDGAVGTFTITGGVERRRSRVGDPVPYTVTIAGAGNIKLLPAPRLAAEGATVSAAGDIAQVDSSQLLVRGSRTFRWMITPDRAGRVVVGPATYAYFDAERARYETLRIPADTLDVAVGVLAAADDAPTISPLPLVRRAPWVPRAPVLDERWFRVAAAVTGLGLLLTWRRPRGATARTPRRAATRTMLARVDDTPLPTMRRTILAELASIAGMTPGEPIDVAALPRRLRRAGVTPETADDVARLVAALDAAVFGVDGASPPSRDHASLLARLRDELRPTVAPRTRWRRVARVLTVTCVGTAIVAAAYAVAPDGTASAAYDAGRWTEAASAFADALSTSPRDPAAWANLGAAQWMRGDTAGAVVAWQRSARLAPFGTPAREWLAASGVSAGGPRAMLPPVPVDLGAIVLLGVIGAGTLVLLVSHRIRPHASWLLLVRAVVTGGAIVGALVVIAAWWSERAEGLVAVRRPVALQAEPAVAGEVVSRAQGGDIAVREAEREAWVRVRLADGRAGWVARDATVPLAAREARAVAIAEGRIARADRAP